RHRLFVCDDRERLERRARQAHVLSLDDEAFDVRVHIGVSLQAVAAGDARQHESPSVALVLACQLGAQLFGLTHGELDKFREQTGLDRLERSNHDGFDRAPRLGLSFDVVHGDSSSFPPAFDARGRAGRRGARSLSASTSSQSARLCASRATSPGAKRRTMTSPNVVSCSMSTTPCLYSSRIARKRTITSRRESASPASSRNDRTW